MKKNLILGSAMTFALTSIVVFNSCNKSVLNKATAVSTNNGIKETDFDPGSSKKAKDLVIDFVSYTNFSAKKLRGDFPNRPTSEGVWLIEGGANYLKNPNYRQHFIETVSFTYTITKTNSTTLSGISLTENFNDLVASINAHELATIYKANLINGYIISETNLDAQVKFDVTFGVPVPDGGLQFAYPTSDQQYCPASVYLTDGINNSLQSGTQFATGVVSHAVQETPFSTGGSGTFNFTRLWFATVSTFPATSFATFHQGGIEIAQAKTALWYPAPTGGASYIYPPTPIAVTIVCDVVVFNSSTWLHRMTNISTAGYMASY
jgi:hypothetical protein